MTNTSADAGPLGFYSDAARRIADAVNLHLTADAAHAAGKWLCFALEDGRADLNLYDSKRDAIRQRGMFASRYGYLQIHPMGMSYEEAASYLKTCRAVADNPNLRWKQTDADAPEEQIEHTLTTFTLDDVRRLRHARHNGRGKGR